MPSDWTMRTSRRHAPESGFLLLLLFILALHGLKALFTFRDAGESPIDEKIFVQITGDIPCPGVYGFSRVPHPTQLLLRAGGKGQASKSGFSFGTSTLHSGQSVDLRTDPPRVSLSFGEMSAFYKITLGIPVSINRETWEGLTSIAGIGPKLALALVRERARRGGFTSLEDLLSVDGVGPALYSKITPYLTL
jgi:competence protein ComEA